MAAGLVAAAMHMQMRVSVQLSARVEGRQQAVLLVGLVLRLQDVGVRPQSIRAAARQALPPVSVSATQQAAAALRFDPPMRRLCSESCRRRAAHSAFLLLINRAGLQGRHRLLQVLAHLTTMPTTTWAPSGLVLLMIKISMEMQQLLLVPTIALPDHLSQLALLRRRGRQLSLQQLLPVPMPIRIA